METWNASDIVGVEADNEYKEGSFDVAQQNSSHAVDEKQTNSMMIHVSCLLCYDKLQNALRTMWTQKKI